VPNWGVGDSQTVVEKKEGAMKWRRRQLLTVATAEHTMRIF